jgi:hypothetical protein
MNLFKIKTTAWDFEDILLVTTLTQEDIVEVIMPLVNAERDGYEEYTNESLVDALKKRYPSDTIDLYYEPNTITI